MKVTKHEGLFKRFLGDYHYGKSFEATTKWVKENDSEVYDCLHDKMLEFLADESNQTYEDDLKDFENGNWEVEYVFREGDADNEIEVLVTAGRDFRAVANQDAWVFNSVQIEDFIELWEVEKYLEMLEK